MTERVTIFEVGPRDGLQSLGLQVPTETKAALIEALSRTGLTKIEATSFVSPRWVPQMADAAEVMAQITRTPGVRYAALTPNLKGMEGAIAAGCDEVAIFASASEGFSRANLNCSIEESFERFAPIMERAREVGMPVRGYLSAVIACPYDGAVAPQTVARWSAKLLEIGCYEVSLGDTIGAGTVETLGEMLDVLRDHCPSDRLAGHFHDTHGNARVLVATALERGLRTFDASVAGLGGCPYAPGSRGNIDTRLVMEVLEAQGFSHGVDGDALAQAEQIAHGIVD
ncbi:hydroxymethylglutaryl-CoA lyase [Celeribacter halophilus]|jgi:hydroxymethylglutaryl-CoA lyase|uniref:hydroxymethylglutaryl-CoA lyase n=1 Tax=Celeribacter halophilus TaxID=576117 RepID=UPI003A9021B7